MNYLRGLSVTAVATGFTFALGFANQALLARGLGPQGRGQLAMVATSVLLGGLVFGEWLNRGNSYHSGREADRLGSIWANTARYGLGLVAAAILVWTVTRIPPVGALLPLSSLQLLFTACLTAAVVAQRGFTAILLGSDRLTAYALIPVLLISGYLSLNGLGLLWLDAGLTGVLAAWLAAAMTAMLVAALLTRAPGRPDRGLLQSTVSVGGRGAVSAILVFLLFRSDVYLVEHFLGAHTLGVYAMAIVVAEMIQRGPNLAGAVLLPKVLRGVDDDHQMSLAVGRWTLLFSVLAAVVVILWGEVLIAWCFGEDYRGAYGPLVWMLPGLVAAGCASVFNTKLAGQGYPPVTLWAPAVALVVNVALNLILIPDRGLTGAAQATAAAYILWALIVLWAYRRHTQIRFLQFLTG